MSSKTSKKLIMAERFVLLNRLPTGGTLVTFKILRKLRETLSPNEKEIEEYCFKDRFRCTHKEYDDKGKAFQCEVEVDSDVQFKCHVHDEFMQPIGRVSWREDMWGVEKEIWFGATAHQIIVDTLKKINEEDKRVDDDVIAGLCEKFLGGDEEEED